MPQRLVVGRVVKAHGIRGEVAVDVESDNPKRFEAGSRLHARDRVLTVKSARPHQGRLLVVFEDVPDRTAAERLRGVELTIDESEAAPLEEWSFYPHQLEGADVVDETGRVLGTLVRVEEGVVHDLWVVLYEGEEVFVPAVRTMVVGVDVQEKRVVVSPPEGLFQ